MDYQQIQASELEAIRDLPDNLRSEQCYNDIQHSMLVILFRHALNAVRSGNLKYTDLLMDNITIYLFIHFLGEEEGMVYSMNKGIYDLDTVRGHAIGHLKFIDLWLDSVYKPFKKSEIKSKQSYEALDGYYARIIRHIDEEDQVTYGAKLDSSDKNHRAESAWVARSNIPLSPLMPGSFEVLRTLDAEAAGLVDRSKLSELALRPMPKINMTKLEAPLLDGQRTSLRDRFFQAAVRHPGVRGVAAA